MDNKTILLIIALLLAGILGLLAVQYNDRPKSLGEQVGEAIEEVGDEIDDATTK